MQFETHDVSGEPAGIVKPVEQRLEMIIDVFMRIAFRQQPHQRRQMRHRIDRMRAR